MVASGFFETLLEFLLLCGLQQVSLPKKIFSWEWSSCAVAHKVPTLPKGCIVQRL